LPSTLVIRFGALGDLCVTSWFLAGLADRPDARPVTLVTKAAFRELAREIPGVANVITLERSGPGGLLQLARNVRRANPHMIIDAHGVVRSRLLPILAGRRVDARLAKDTAARRRLLRNPGTSNDVPAELRRHLLDRLDALSDDAPGRARLADPPAPPLAHLRTGNVAERRDVALAPGARWPSKHWPDKYFHDTAHSLLEDGFSLRVFLGPGESGWFDASPMADLASHPNAEILRDRDLVSVARGLAHCRVTLCNDSGLLHLSEAVGTPVAALFGPTVPAFGYAPLLPGSRLLEIDLDCRPCSRTGSRPCHRGDLACLTGITPAVAAAAVRDVLEARS